MSIGDTCYAAIENGAAWEIGIYTYSAANTLTRTTVLKSSNSDALINVGLMRLYLYHTSQIRPFIKIALVKL